MIKLIDRLPDGFKADCAASVRIKSLFNAYGGYDLALFWAQTDRSGRLTALLSKTDSDLTVWSSDSADEKELAEFIRAVSGSTVMSNRRLPLDNCTTVLQLTANGRPTGESGSLKDVYEIMSTCFEMPEFSVWYADMSHRVRHSSARAVCSENSAACLLIADGVALMVGLSTRPECRSRGHAARLLSGILNPAESRLFTLAQKDLVPFYVNRGFKLCGEHYLYSGDV